MKCEHCNNELNKCPVCDSGMIVARANKRYYSCTECNIQILIGADVSCDKEFYNEVYLEDIPAEKNVLTINRTHYAKIFDMLNNEVEYTDMCDIVDRKITTCYCYGGGFPQIEMFLPVDTIQVYDLIAPKYSKNIKVLKEVYDNPSVTIKYKTHDLLNGIVKSTEPSFITFVHILEHFSGDDIRKIFASVDSKLAKNSYGLIYQPNILKAKHKDWVHYVAHDQHLTFYTIDVFTTLINSFKNLEVIHSMTFSDDLLILFKRI